MATSVSAKVPPRRRRTPSLADPYSFSSSRDILRRCAFATCPGAPSHLPPLSSGQGILPYAEGAGGGLQYGDLGGRPMSLWVDKRSRLNLAARAFRARRSDRGTKSPSSSNYEPRPSSAVLLSTTDREGIPGTSRSVLTTRLRPHGLHMFYFSDPWICPAGDGVDGP